MKYTVGKLKNMGENISNQLDQMEERTGDLKDRSSENKGRGETIMKRNKDSFLECWGKIRRANI
jgi:hypothetical protein